MSASEFEPYQVDHLFLLIGENPLPNYVAAKLLVNKDGTIYLVHTTDTYETARNLKNILIKEDSNLEDKVGLITLGNYESDAYHIKTEISKTLTKISNGIIGLNYTGGTKAMSAHSYRTLFYEEIKENNGSNNKKYKQRENIIFTYLDSRKLKMCIDTENGKREFINIKPSTLEVDLVKLFNLHRLNLTNIPEKEGKLLNLARAMVNLFSNDTTENDWFSAFYKEFYEQARKKKANGSTEWKNPTELTQVSVSIENLPEEIVTAFARENFIINNQLSLKQVQNTNSFTKLKHFCEWLDGLWLEHYVLEEVKKISSDQFIQENYGMTFKIPLEGTKEGFEFDIAFTRGYQLFAISCTTSSDRKLCKSKLFEAYLRAKQMGGDEARVILVCCYNDPDSIKSEIGNLLDQKKIAVFGCKDLIDLSTKISTWINQKDEEVK